MSNINIDEPYPWQVWRKRDGSALFKIILIANLNFDRLVIYAPAQGISDPQAMQMGLFMTDFERAPK